MPSNLIITFQSKADTTGIDQLGKGMEDMKKKMQDTAAAGNDIATSFSNLKNILVGAVLTLPLTGFIKEAIASEEVTARFSMQLKSLGQSLEGVDIEGLTQKVHQFGITQTELISSLSKGLPYFKSTENELKLLDTAIGMTRYSGVSLATAFQQLGYIMQYGATRVARQYGVAMHNDVHDPTKRGALVIEELTQKMSPLATSSGTTSEALKEMGAIIGDTGEKIASEFLKPIAQTAEAFNKLSPALQENIIRVILYSTAIGGLSLAFLALNKALAGSALMASLSGLQGIFALPFVSNIGKMQMAVTGLAAAFGTLTIAGAGIAAISLIQTEAGKVKDAFANAEKAEAAYFNTVMSAMKARASDASSSISNEEKFTDKVRETETVYKNLLTQQTLFRLQGNKAAEENAAKQANSVKALLDSQKIESDELSKHNVATLDQYQKFQYKMVELRIQAMKGGNDKDLAEFNLKMTKEKDAMIKMYGNEMDVRLALTKAEQAQEAAVWKKGIDAELDYALLSMEERKKYDEDYQAAKSRFAGMSFEGFKQSEDALKDLAKTAGGKKALDEATLAWGEQKAAIANAEMEQKLYNATAAEIAQLYQNNKSKGIEWLNKEAEAIRDKKRAELEEQQTGIKNLKSFTAEEKTINAKAEFAINTTVNITPNLSEIGKAAGAAVQDVVNKNAKNIEDATKQRLS